MKKTLLSILLLSATVYFTKAQISLTSEDFPYVGLDIHLFEADGGSGPCCIQDSVSPGTGGANDTFDFANLYLYKKDSMWWKYVNPSFYPFGSDYPTANLAAMDPDFMPDTSGTDTVAIGVEFYIKNATGFYMVGLTGFIDSIGWSTGGMITGSIIDTASMSLARIDTLFEVNYTYGTQHTDSSYFNGQINDSAAYISHTRRNIDVDAWGTITTPLGTFDSILRMKVVEYNNDTMISGSMPVMASPDTQYYFIYYAPSIGYPIVKAYTDSGYTSVYGARYVGSTNWVASPVSTGDELDVKVNMDIYPNPAGKQVNVTIGSKDAKNLQIIIYNAIGQKVWSEAVHVNRTYNNTLNLSHLGKGLYFITVNDTKGASLFVKKLVLNK